MLSNVRVEVEALGEDLAECLRAEILESAKEIGGQVGRDIGRIELGNGDEADDIVEHRTAEHAPQDSALDLLLGQRADDEHGDQGDEHREDACPCGAAGKDVEGSEVDERCAVVNDDARVLKADEGDEQADAGGNGRLDRGGNGVEDHLAQAGDGQQDEDDAIDQNQNQRVCVAQAEAEADRVDKECVQAHAGRLRQRQVRQKADQDRADDGRDGGRDVDRAVADRAEACEHAGVDHQNVGHRHEGGDTGHDLCPDGGSMLLQVKSFLHENSPSLCDLPRQNGSAD